MTEYEESTRVSKDGIVRKTRIVRHRVKSYNKDNRDRFPENKPKPPKIESRTAAASGFGATMPKTEGDEGL